MQCLEKTLAGSVRTGDLQPLGGGVAPLESYGPQVLPKKRFAQPSVSKTLLQNRILVKSERGIF